MMRWGVLELEAERARAAFCVSTKPERASFIVGLITSSDEGEAAESSGNNARLHFCALTAQLVIRLRENVSNAKGEQRRK